MTNYKIAFVFEGPYHLHHIPTVLMNNNRDYITVGNFENNEEMFKCVQDLIQKGTEIIVTAGGYYDYISSRVQIPVISIKRSFATIALVANKARAVSEKVGFIARKGILYYSALQYKKEFNDPIILESFASDTELKEKLLHLKSKGVDTLIVGSRGSQIAPKYGFKCFTVPFEDLDIMWSTNEAEHILKYLESTERTNHILKLIQNSVHEGLLATDNNDQINEINNFALSSLSLTRQEISGKQLQDTILKPITELPAYKKNQSTIAELVTINNSLYAVSLIPIQNNADTSMIITFTPVNQIERAEKKLLEKMKGKGHVANYHFSDIIGQSDALHDTIDRAKKFARVDSAVLICAETGCGKEMFAQSIHNSSRRRNGPFVVVNCAALPETLLESYLFGYEKGAFTGASKEGRQGAFLIADGGTIFLDEVSEMPLSLQARFLRVLQEKEVVPLGSDEVIPIDVRVIAATNRNMNEFIKDGKFRNDLYYRLAVLQLNIPNLNQRKEDIPELVQHFLYSKSVSLKLPCPEIMSTSLEYMKSLSYPGNIRQLQNITERMLVLHDSVDAISLDLIKSITKNEIMPEQQVASEVHENNQWNEREEIIKALNKCKNNRNETAEMLGISTVTLWRKLKKYNLA